mmetsp:Transcript_2723/g.4945  ORF Transcript_2723/g.4945 Transcript_2723/m.4945 type:complete len:133 (-) Transcript_2723:1024-1422(-)
MYRMVAVGNKNPNKLTVQYNKLATANSRPNVPKGLGARAHSQIGPNRKALYATGIKIRIGNGVRARREMVSLMTWKQSKKRGLAQAVAATMLGTPRAQDEPVLHDMPPMQYHVTARRGAVSPTAEPTRSHSR